MRYAVISAVAASMVFLASHANANSIIVSVDSQSSPWDQTLNPTLQFGDGSGSAPFSVSSGFSFAPGSDFTITYLDGLTNPYGGAGYADGDGDTGYAADANGGSSGLGFPSKYFTPAVGNLNALVGAFADSSGVVVGTPFLIGNGPFHAFAPGGAQLLLLGFNDDIFGDNTGSLRVQIDEADAIPEPATWGLMLMGFGGLGLVLRRRRNALTFA